jgi:hypothetical protein
MRGHFRIAFLATVVPLFLACQRESSDTKEAVEKYLNARYLVPVETGVVIADAQRANAFEAAEADGLIGLRQLPQSYAIQTQGTPYEVTPKQKLLDAAEPEQAVVRGASNRVITVRVASAAVTEILSIEEYTGSLAEATAKCRLVLGRFQYKRLPGQATLGFYLGRMSAALAIPVIDGARDSDWKGDSHIFDFRTVLKYIQF